MAPSRRLQLDDDDYDCEDCDAGVSCGMCLVLALPDECPSDINQFQHMLDKNGLAVRSRCVDVDYGEACEGSGECSTNDNADNCMSMSDVYKRVECFGDFAPEPLFELPSPPVPSPPPPPPPTPPPEQVPALSGPHAALSTGLPMPARVAATSPADSSPSPADNSPLIVALLGAFLLVALFCGRKWLYRTLWLKRQGAAAAGLIAGGVLSSSIVNQGAGQQGRSAPLVVLGFDPCASSGRAWWLWAARHTRVGGGGRGGTGPPGA